MASDRVEGYEADDIDPSFVCRSQTCGCGGAGRRPLSAWNLRYAPHMGYIRGVAPTLRHRARGDALTRNIDEMVALGFGAVLHPWLPYLDPGERAEAVARISASPLRGSVIAATAWREMKLPVWAATDRVGRVLLEKRVSMAARVAAEVGSRVLCIVIAQDPLMPREAQMAAVRANLRTTAQIAGRHGVALAIEPNRALPNMLLRSFEEALLLIDEVEVPNLGLIYDTAHACALCNDPLSTFNDCFKRIFSIQLADEPGRVEPGRGTSGFPFVEMLATAISNEFGGIVDLEFGWSNAGEAAELSGIEHLRQLDTAAGVLAGTSGVNASLRSVLP